MRRNPSALSESNRAAVAAQAARGSRTASATPVPQLPQVDGATQSPRRVVRAIGSGISALVNAVTSPFRGAPVDDINASPSTSVDNSLLTTATPLLASPEEVEASITNQALLDYQQEGDGGDSDIDGDEAAIHTEATELLARLGIDKRRNAFTDEMEADLDYDDEGEEFEPSSHIPGAPPNWLPPQPPETFTGYRPKPNSGAPSTFGEVDNPGGWSEFVFQPRYNKQNKYTNHYTPCGAVVLPPDAQGKRVVNGWEFFYNGWEGDEFSRDTFVRGAANANNIRPDERVGVLDVDLLKRFGISKETMDSPLLWYQLLFPICDPAMSGVENDGRMPFYTYAAACSNIYAYAAKNWGSGYSHAFNQVSETELVRWNGIPIRNGARSGNPGTIHYRWCPADPDYDSFIADAMTYTRYRQIKAIFKINNNMVEPKPGQPGYDPCNKYDYIFKTLVHNMNYFTKRAELDFGLDESTWGFGGYMAECGGRLKNKPFNKGD